jgi:hypothetical protein
MIVIVFDPSLDLRMCNSIPESRNPAKHGNHGGSD